MKTIICLALLSLLTGCAAYNPQTGKQATPVDGLTATGTYLAKAFTPGNREYANTSTLNAVKHEMRKEGFVPVRIPRNYDQYDRGQRYYRDSSSSFVGAGVFTGRDEYEDTWAWQDEKGIWHVQSGYATYSEIEVAAEAEIHIVGQGIDVEKKVRDYENYHSVRAQREHGGKQK